jgi:hypothetical protein
MNDAALKYKVYKILLESDISNDQRNLMVELGIVDTIKSMFRGAGKTAGRAFSVLKDDIAQEKLGSAQKNLKSAIDDLRDIAKKAGKDDAFVNALLQQLLQSSGTDPQAVASASPEAAAGGSKGKSAGGSAAAPAPGAPVTTQTITQNPKLATVLIAAATDKKASDVAPKVEDKKPDATAITKVVARAASKATGVKDDVVGKVIQTLFDAGKLKLESRKEKRDILVEQFFGRWGHLAGLYESPKMLKFILGKVERGEIKDVLDLNKPDVIAQMKQQKQGKLTDDELAQIIDALEKKKVIKPSEEGKAKEEIKKAVDAAAAGSEKGQPGKGSSSELSKVVRDKIKPEEISDEDLGKVIGWVEEFLDKAADVAAASEKEAK